MATYESYRVNEDKQCVLPKRRHQVSLAICTTAVEHIGIGGGTSGCCCDRCIHSQIPFFRAVKLFVGQ